MTAVIFHCSACAVQAAAGTTKVAVKNHGKERLKR